MDTECFVLCCCCYIGGLSSCLDLNCLFLLHIGSISSRFVSPRSLSHTTLEHCTLARRYEFYVLVAKTISHSFASLTREILFLPLEPARGGEEDICQNIFSVRGICYHSDFFISWIQRLFSSTRLNCSVQKLICRTQTWSDGSRQTRPKHHTRSTTCIKITNQNSKPSQRNYYAFPKWPAVALFYWSFQGLEDKGFTNGIISTIIRYFWSYVARGLSRWFTQTRARGVRVTQKRSIVCSENTGHNELFKG